MLKQTFLTFSHPIFKTNILYNLFFFSSKMANYASIPLHTSTESMWEYGDGRTPQNIKITAWNVNGIRSVLKKGEIQKYIQSSNPDIICLNQTKLDLKAFVKEKNNLINDFGVVFDTTKEKAESESRGQHYYWYWNFCKVSSGYSGVATLSKYKPIRAIQDFVMDHHMSLQGRCITLQYEKFYIVNCYKPNSGSQLDRLPQRTQIYDTKFTEFIKNLTSHKPVLICSDMNVAHKQIDIAKPKSNQKTAGFTIEQRQSFSKFLTQAKCVDAYRLLYPNKVQYTWWSTRMAAREKNIGWRIDYVLCSDAKFVKDVRIRGDVMGSDHCPVQAILQI